MSTAIAMFVFNLSSDKIAHVHIYATILLCVFFWIKSNIKISKFLTTLTVVKNDCANKSFYVLVSHTMAHFLKSIFILFQCRITNANSSKTCSSDCQYTQMRYYGRILVCRCRVVTDVKEQDERAAACHGRELSLAKVRTMRTAGEGRGSVWKVDPHVGDV